MKTLSIFLLALMPHLVSAQQSVIDSLLTELHAAKEDTTKVILFNELAGLYLGLDAVNSMKYSSQANDLAEKLSYSAGLSTSYRHLGKGHFLQGNLDESEANYKLAMKLFEQQNNAKMQAAIWQDLADLYFDNGDYHRSTEYYRQAIEIGKESGDSIINSISYIGIGKINFRKGDYPKALQMSLRGLKLLEKKEGYLKQIASTYRFLGELYRMLDQYDKALEYHRNALKIFEEDGNQTEIAGTLLNIGVVYQIQRKYTEALEYYFSAMEKFKTTGRKIGVGMAIQNIGDIYQKQGDYGKAFEYHQKALILCEEIDDNEGVVYALREMGSDYYMQGQYSLATEAIERSLILANNIGLNHVVRDIYNDLMRLDTLQGDFKKAFNHLRLLYNKERSIFNETSSNQIAEMQTKYETEKKEKEIQIQALTLDKQEAELSQQKNFRNFLILFFIVAAFIGFLLFNRFKLRQKNQQTELKRKNIDIEHRLLRAQMNPHFIFNSLNSIQSYVSKNDTYSAERYLSDFGSLMRSILENSGKSEISVEEEINSLNLYLTLEQLRSGHKFDFEINVAENVDAEFMAIPPMLVQPYIENAIIHGIMNKTTNGNIKIDFTGKENVILCVIEDDGIGREKAMEIRREKKDMHQSMGMQVTKDRLDLLNSQKKIDISFEITDLKDEKAAPLGTRVELKIPYEELI